MSWFLLDSSFVPNRKGGETAESWGWETGTADGLRHSRCLVFFFAAVRASERASVPIAQFWVQRMEDGRIRDGWVGLVGLGEIGGEMVCMDMFGL